MLTCGNANTWQTQFACSCSFLNLRCEPTPLTLHLFTQIQSCSATDALNTINQVVLNAISDKLSMRLWVFATDAASPTWQASKLDARDCSAVI